MGISSFKVAVVSMLVAHAAFATPLLECRDQMQPQLFNDSGKLVICVDSSQCLSIGEQRLVARPIQEPMPKVEFQEGMLCFDETCKKPGQRLAAALAKDLKFSASRDLSLVLVEGDFWNVKTDRKFRLKFPPDSSEHYAGAIPGQIVGNTIVLTWTPCAGPCTIGQIYDRHGKARGETFVGGPSTELDGHRLAVMGNNAEGKLTIIDTQTFKVLSVKHVTSEIVNSSAIIRVSTDRVAVFWRVESDGKMFVALYNVTGKPKLVQRRIEVMCKENP